MKAMPRSQLVPSTSKYKGEVGQTASAMPDCMEVTPAPRNRSGSVASAVTMAQWWSQRAEAGASVFGSTSTMRIFHLGGGFFFSGQFHRDLRLARRQRLRPVVVFLAWV